MRGLGNEELHQAESTKTENIEKTWGKTILGLETKSKAFNPQNSKIIYLESELERYLRY